MDEKKQKALEDLRRQTELRNSMGGHPYWLICNENLIHLKENAFDAGCFVSDVMEIIGEDKYVY